MSESVRPSLGSVVTVAVAVVSIWLSCSALALAAGDASMSTCPFETEASPGFRSYLPDCRAYELVTPSFEAGAAAEVIAASSNGQHLLATDEGGFAGTENDEQGGFERGAVYEFSRTPVGWTTEAWDPPASKYPRRKLVAGSADLSRSLWELPAQPGEGEELLELSRGIFYAVRERTPEGVAFEPVGPAPELASNSDAGIQGASQDLTHILFTIHSQEQRLWPGDKTREGVSLYEYVGTGNREPTLVGVRNKGPLSGRAFVNEDAELISECGTILGSGGQIGHVSAYNAISASGSVIYFTALHGEGCEVPRVNELYARVNGSSTVAISEPAMTLAREAECEGECRRDEDEEDRRSPATFEGAAEDGSRVFFTTEQPLLSSDKDTTNDLYEAEVGESGVERLVQVSKGEGPTPGSGARVVGVVRISEDGSHAYFVARGVLTTRTNDIGDKAEEGAYNLYVYNSESSRTSFVATLLTSGEEAEIKHGVEESERVQEDKAEISRKEVVCNEFREEHESAKLETCEQELNEKKVGLAREVGEKVSEEVVGRTGVRSEDRYRPFEATPNGGFLLFVNGRRLTGSEDTSTVSQAFEYDATTEKLVRVSIGQAGFDDNGNTTNIEDAPTVFSPQGEGNIYSMPTQAASFLPLSEDGRAFFTSREALTLQAVGGRENVYEYEPDEVGGCGQAGGCVYLVSPGDEAAPLESSPRLFGADESGGDVFLYTTDNLVPQDTDTQLNVYDAREDGGFPGVQSSVACVGSECEGPIGATPLLPVPGSASTAGAGNLAAPASAVAPKVKPLTRAQKLAKALRACRAKPKRKRAVCKSRARRMYDEAKGKGKGGRE